jgi:hypothetical protein
MLRLYFPILPFIAVAVESGMKVCRIRDEIIPDPATLIRIRFSDHH